MRRDLAVLGEGVVVAAEGARLWCWRGTAPWWTVDLPARVHALAGQGARLHVLDEAGGHEERKLQDGAWLRSHPPAAGTPGTWAWGPGCVAVATDRDVRWTIEGGGKGLVELPGVLYAAWSADGAWLALLDASGALTVVDVARAVPSARITAGGRPWGVAWHPDGYWWVGAGEALRAVRADGQPCAPPVQGGLLGASQLALGPDGLVAAVVGERGRVWLVDLQAGEGCGHLSVGRAVHRVAWDVDHTLWLLVHGVDLVAVDLLAGRAVHGASHPGQVPRPASVELAFDAGRIRGALATRQAGGMPLARAGQGAQPAPPARGRWMWAAATGALLVALALLAWILLT